MKKSFTDKHNIRKSFGKIPDLVNMPNLLEIQKNSYDLFLQKDLAKTLKRISKFGRDEFYSGKTAKKIISYFKKNGGIFTQNDFLNYQELQTFPLGCHLRLNLLLHNHQNLYSLMLLKK